jgi:hypothetical protein
MEVRGLVGNGREGRIEVDGEGRLDDGTDTSRPGGGKRRNKRIINIRTCPT